VHFTHVDHLATIVRDGLLSDTLAQTMGLLSVEVGNHEINEKGNVPTYSAGCDQLITW
jgi:hypothetical protein